MKLYLLIFLILTACGGGSENPVTDNFIPNTGIDINDLIGNWGNTCTLNENYSDIYKREFLETFKTDSSNPNGISIGYRNYGDTNCIQLPAIRYNNDGEIEPITLYQGSNLGISPVGLYITAEGVETKVVELSTNYNGSSRMAYLVNENILYFTFESNQGFIFDFNNPYFPME